MLDRCYALKMTICLLATIFVATRACPIGSTQGMTSDVCYYFVKNSFTWLNAENDCIQRGGHLASITNSFESSFLRNLGQENSAHMFWIGGTNILIPGSWNWMDGMAFSYSNWAQGK